MACRYKVIGTQPILEHQPGETFEANVPRNLERFLIGIGGLEVLKDAPAKGKGDGPPKPS